MFGRADTHGFTDGGSNISFVTLCCGIVGDEEKKGRVIIFLPAFLYAGQRVVQVLSV